MFWGPSIMKGYFRNPEKTAEALTHDGWMASGDVAQWLPGGALKIVDRAKNIFKLSQGEYIAPEKLENVYVQSKWVVQNWIYGDSLRDHVIGFFVLDPETAAKHAQENNTTVDALLNDETFRQTVYDDLMRLAVEGKLNSLEKPKQIMLLSDPWTIENDYLTPTMKMKRNVAKDKLRADIDRMYGEPIMKETKK